MLRSEIQEYQEYKKSELYVNSPMKKIQEKTPRIHDRK